jgi:predicted nucleic acid-binding protein
MRFALDSNIILYSEGINDPERSAMAQNLIEAMDGLPVIIPLQALGETLNVFTRKLSLSKASAVERLQPWRDDYLTQETNVSIFQDAVELVSKHDFQIWDGIILSAASYAGASFIFSEDMQDGFIWQGTRVVNPFAAVPDPIIPALLYLH